MLNLWNIWILCNIISSFKEIHFKVCMYVSLCLSVIARPWLHIFHLYTSPLANRLSSVPNSSAKHSSQYKCQLEHNVKRMVYCQPYSFPFTHWQQPLSHCAPEQRLWPVVIYIQRAWERGNSIKVTGYKNTAKVTSRVLSVPGLNLSLSLCESSAKQALVSKPFLFLSPLIQLFYKFYISD